jgi:hypothetical protein
MTTKVLTARVASSLAEELARAAASINASTSEMITVAVENLLVTIEERRRSGQSLGPVEAATKAQVEAKGLEGDPRAAAAVALARRIDFSPTSTAQNISQLRALLDGLFAPEANSAPPDELHVHRLHVRLALAGYRIVRDDGTEAGNPDAAALVEVLALALGRIAVPGDQAPQEQMTPAEDGQ